MRETRSSGLMRGGSLLAACALGLLPTLPLSVLLWAHRPRHRFNRQARHTILALITVRAKDSIRKLERKDQRSFNAAWRHAAEAWLVCQGLITVSSTQKSVTPFS
jgi:hypothetical protein